MGITMKQVQVVVGAAGSVGVRLGWIKSRAWDAAFCWTRPARIGYAPRGRLAGGSRDGAFGRAAEERGEESR